MQRVAVAVRLKPGSADRAAELIATGPPFDPRAAGFERHNVFLAPDEVIFVFEGGSLEPLARLLGEATDPEVLGAWADIAEGAPRLVPEAFAWARPAEPLAPGWS